jgi:hypothetical protein
MSKRGATRVAPIEARSDAGRANPGKGGVKQQDGGLAMTPNAWSDKLWVSCST